MAIHWESDGIFIFEPWEHGIFDDICGKYPLVNIQKTMERSTIFHGKTHYKWQFSIAMLNYQRVDGMGWGFLI